MLEEKKDLINQPEQNQDALQNFEINLNNQDSMQNPEINNNIPKGVIMDEENIQQPEENQDASQNPNANEDRQDSSDSTQSKESASVSRSSKPSSKEVASLKNAVDKKTQKTSGLEKDIADINAILDRGYYKVVTNEEKGTVRFDYLTDSDRQFEQHRLRQLMLEHLTESEALKELKKQFKALTTRSIDGSKHTFAVMKENSRNRTVSNNAVNALKKVVTKETIKSYPSLNSFAQGKQDNWIELESFFSTNLSSAYDRFSSKPELKERIFSRSTTYIKNLTK